MGLRPQLRSLVAVLTASLLQCATVASASTSVIWCIGSDGHAGVERQTPGEDCASCCDDGSSGAGLHAPDGCTDVSLHSAKAVPSKDPPGGHALIAAVDSALAPLRCLRMPCVSRSVANPSIEFRRTTVLRI
jgi:hypothetical protein